MDKQTEEYYQNYFSLFRSKGWSQLLKDLSENAGVINNITQIGDSDVLFFRKGQLDILGNIIQLETVVQTNFEQVEESASEEGEETSNSLED